MAPLLAGEAIGLSPECLLVVASSGSQRPVLMTVLSPRMVYSVTEWPRMRAAAEAEGFDAVAWWAADVVDEEGAAAAEMAGWPVHEIVRVARVPAECAGSVGRPNHFPFSRVLDRGELHAWPIWGVMPNQAWIDSLRWRLQSLRQPREMRQP
jgi:hypothetical protein